MKKNSMTKSTKTSSASSSLHPPYSRMISQATTTMKDRTGSSQSATAKLMLENYNKQLPSNFKRTPSVQSKRIAKSEKLVEIKNSYKISSTEKVMTVKNSYKFSSTEKVKGYGGNEEQSWSEAYSWEEVI